MAVLVRGLLDLTADGARVDVGALGPDGLWRLNVVSLVKLRRLSRTPARTLGLRVFMMAARSMSAHELATLRLGLACLCGPRRTADVRNRSNRTRWDGLSWSSTQMCDLRVAASRTELWACSGCVWSASSWNKLSSSPSSLGRVRHRSAAVLRCCAAGSSSGSSTMIFCLGPVISYLLSGSLARSVLCCWLSRPALCYASWPPYLEVPEVDVGGLGDFFDFGRGGALGVVQVCSVRASLPVNMSTRWSRSMSRRSSRMCVDLQLLRPLTV